MTDRRARLRQLKIYLQGYLANIEDAMKHQGMLGNGLFDETIEKKANSLAESLGWWRILERGTENEKATISVMPFTGNEGITIGEDDRLSPDWPATVLKYIRSWLHKIDEE